MWGDEVGRAKSVGGVDVDMDSVIGDGDGVYGSGGGHRSVRS